MTELQLWMRRLLMLLFGVLVTECGSQLYVALDVGADPFMVLVQGVSQWLGLSYGQSSTVLMLLCLVVLLVFARRQIRPGTIFCMFCLGPIVDSYAWLFARLLPQERPLWLTVLLVVVGCVLVSIGIGISVRSEAGACANDLIPVIAASRWTGRMLGLMRMLWDLLCIAVGWLLGGTPGMGTVIAVTLFGPGLQLFLPVAKRIARCLNLPESTEL